MTLAAPSADRTAADLRTGGSHRIRAGLALLALLGLLVASACTADTQRKESAQDVADQFAAAVGAGDLQTAASLTTEPQRATADLTFAAQQLQEPTLSYVPGKVSAGSHEATTSYAVEWTVLGQQLRFTVDVLLVTDEQNRWKLQWSPSLIHPDLAGDRHLEIVQNPGSTPTVLDRNSQPILSEQLVTVVRITPSEVTDPAAVSQALAAAVGGVVPTITTESLMSQIAASQDPFTVVALRADDVAQIQIPQLPGISHNRQKRLLSTHKSLKSPALSGLGEIWDEAAKQSTGWRLEVQDAQNSAIETLLEVPAAPIATISTTFDANVQAAAQAAVDQVSGQAVVVALQPSSGGILAVAQNAAADAEGPIALTGQYPPGSAFKIVSTAAVLSAGAAAPGTVLPCPGVASISGRTIANDDQFDLGDVPLRTAFAQSCNTTIAALAGELPADALNRTAGQFGLGIDYVAPGITTVTGSVPPATSDAEQVEGSIGQGKVVASPFGMAQVAATVASGNAPLPTLLPGRPTTADQSPSAPAPETIVALRAMMTEVVQSGTATAVADIEGIAGKTGTAQYGDGSTAHGWFVGYYKDMAFAVLLLDAGSSGPAVEVAGSFIRPIEDLVPG